MMRLARTLVLLAVLVGETSVATAACSGVAITVSKGALTDREKNRLESQLRTAVDKVCDWWGETFSGRLSVDILTQPGPSMALVPAWRGQRGHMLFRARVVGMGRAASVHEVTHVFAPNANRFLAEGLAVYAHEFLRGPPAYPNFGRPLHAAAQSYAKQADIAALERIATPSRLQNGGLGDREAYLVAGSFVQFLIERHGMAKFRRLYAMTPMVPAERNAGSPGRWQAVYDAPLQRLAEQCRQRINTNAVD
jgi:hypothetical protein